MHRFWIFNHYATTPLTGPLLRHYYFAEYLKERNIETTVFAANELHQTGGCVDTHGKPYLRTEEEGVPFVFVKTSKYEGNGISRVKNMVSFFLGLLKISKGYAKQYCRNSGGQTVPGPGYRRSPRSLAGGYLLFWKSKDEQSGRTALKCRRKMDVCPCGCHCVY